MMGRLFVPLQASYTEDPKILSITDRAELLYVRGLCYCKIHWETDGFIHHRALGKFTPFADEIPAVELADQLVKVDLWTTVDDGYLVTNWLGHNLSADQIRKAKRDERDRKAEWREKKRSRDTVRDNGTDAGTDNRTDMSRDASVPTSFQPERQRIERESSSSVRDTVRDNGTDASRTRRVEDACRELARRDVERFVANGGSIRSESAYTKSCYEARRRDHASDLHRMAHADPTLTALDLADLIDAPPSPRTSSPDPFVATAAAAQAAYERERRRTNGLACPECDDRGIIELDDGTVDRCPHLDGVHARS